MHICYIDESGGAEAPNRQIPGVTPVQVLVGLILDANRIVPFTRDFLGLKRRHFPKQYANGPALNHLLQEVKGTEVLQRTRSNRRGHRRHAARIRADLLDLLETYDARIVGRVWVKEPTRGLDPVPAYCYAVQDISRHFSHFMITQNSQGLVIADARSHRQNVRAAHSVFTDKFRTGDDPIPAIVEAPTFSQSDNHAGLQVADLVASTLIFPMACSAYCASTATGAHASPRYAEVRADSGTRTRELQYMYRNDNGRTAGGIVVSDKVAGRSAAVMFKP